MRNISLADLPSSNAPVVDIAFGILQTYLRKHEKTGETTLHEEVAMELLTHDINFPTWFEESFKVSCHVTVETSARHKPYLSVVLKVSLHFVEERRQQIAILLHPFRRLGQSHGFSRPGDRRQPGAQKCRRI